MDSGAGVAGGVDAGGCAGAGVSRGAGAVGATTLRNSA